MRSKAQLANREVSSHCDPEAAEDSLGGDVSRHAMYASVGKC
jgi:hypothetical protein